jgi:hypothetical protein
MVLNPNNMDNAQMSLRKVKLSDTYPAVPLDSLKEIEGQMESDVQKIISNIRSAANEIGSVLNSDPILKENLASFMYDMYTYNNNAGSKIHDSIDILTPTETHFTHAQIHTLLSIHDDRGETLQTKIDEFKNTCSQDGKHEICVTHDVFPLYTTFFRDVFPTIQVIRQQVEAKKQRDAIQKSPVIALVIEGLRSRPPLQNSELENARRTLVQSTIDALENHTEDMNVVLESHRVVDDYIRVFDRKSKKKLKAYWNSLSQETKQQLQETSLRTFIKENF